MRRPAGFWLALAITAILLGAAVEAAVRLVDVRATLRGEVVADGLARVGDQVSEGDPLVYVRTQIGRAPAARAPVDGRVAEVLVSPGTEIRELGAVVARLEPR
jgi:biotin carboxyl carrier protein